MPTDHFVFTPTPCIQKDILPQVSQALEKRTELISRLRYPKLWEITDSLRNISKGRPRSRVRTRVMSGICLVLGVLLLVPGLMEPQELMVPLVTGAVATSAGIGGLWRSRKHRKNPFDKSAGILLSRLQTLPEDQTLQVIFSREGMALAESAQTVQTFPWEQFECAVETEDTYLFIYEGKVTLLQKKDLTEGTLDEFRALLSANIQNYALLGKDLP